MYQRADPEIFLGGGGSKGNILLEVNLKKFAFSGGGECVPDPLNPPLNPHMNDEV